MPYRPTWDSHLVVNPVMKAGDLLIFTEVRSHDALASSRPTALTVAAVQALVHGTRAWASGEPRRSLLFKYNNGYSTWSDPAALDGLRELATTPLQQALLRPPGVQDSQAEGQMRLPLPELEDAGRWGDAGWLVGIGPRGGTKEEPALPVAKL